MPDSVSAAIDELHSIRDFIRWGASQFTTGDLFFGHGTDNALDEAAWLVLDVLSLPLDLSDEYRDCRLTRAERQAVAERLIARITTRKPAAYLTGTAWFCGLPFQVDESVLVPRSPLAELIETRFSPWVAAERVTRILDLCSGSGCIGIAAAYAFPEAQVDLAELSSDAVALSEQNVASHALSERVTVYESDLFAAVPEQRYDLIVSNPPYVDAQDMAALPAEFRHEPELGLAAGEDGLNIVRRILSDAAEYLTETGALVVEVGNSQAALEAAYPELPFVWLEFERGGHGVFYLPAAALRGRQNA